RDAIGCGNKFQTPTIANGKVYVGTQNELDVFGLLPSNPVTPVPSISNPCLSFTSNVGVTSAPQTTTLTNLGPGTLSIAGVSVLGINPSEFKITNNCGRSLTVTKNCTITVTFTPAIAKIPQQAYLQIKDNAIGGALTLQLIGTGK
ncbi:MAG: choice-of-anchor D domain-containing protein, partial [Candidatus Sulfotelmatobacter sp.]